MAATSTVRAASASAWHDPWSVGCSHRVPVERRHGQVECILGASRHPVGRALLGIPRTLGAGCVEQEQRALEGLLRYRGFTPRRCMEAAVGQARAPKPATPRIARIVERCGQKIIQPSTGDGDDRLTARLLGSKMACSSSMSTSVSVATREWLCTTPQRSRNYARASDAGAGGVSAAGPNPKDPRAAVSGRRFHVCSLTLQRFDRVRSRDFPSVPSARRTPAPTRRTGFRRCARRSAALVARSATANR
jgi:hypothetical protein